MRPPLRLGVPAAGGDIARKVPLWTDIHDFVPSRQGEAREGCSIRQIPIVFPRVEECSGVPKCASTCHARVSENSSATSFEMQIPAVVIDLIGNAACPKRSLPACRIRIRMEITGLHTAAAPYDPRHLREGFLDRRKIVHHQEQRARFATVSGTQRNPHHLWANARRPLMCGLSRRHGEHFHGEINPQDVGSLCMSGSHRTSRSASYVDYGEPCGVPGAPIKPACRGQAARFRSAISSSPTRCDVPPMEIRAIDCSPSAAFATRRTSAPTQFERK